MVLEQHSRAADFRLVPGCSGTVSSSAGHQDILAMSYHVLQRRYNEFVDGGET